MKYWVTSMILAGFMVLDLSAAVNGPEVRVLDNKVSISVDGISLGRLLQLLDRATGMQSTVPAAMANRNLTVKFVDLSFDDAVRKIFEGQPIDYVVVAQRGIVVTALSQMTGPDSAPAPAYNQGQSQTEQQSFIDDNQGAPPAPAFPPQPGGPQGMGMQGGPQGIPGGPPNSPFNQQQQQPAVIQTPFGPIPNPRANQPIQQNAVPGQATPFGAVAPFNPTPAGQNNNVFGNTSPQLFPNQTPPAK